MTGLLSLSESQLQQHSSSFSKWQARSHLLLDKTLAIVIAPTESCWCLTTADPSPQLLCSQAQSLQVHEAKAGRLTASS